MKLSRNEKMSIRGICTVSVFAGLMLAVCGCSTPTLIGTDAAVYSNGNEERSRVIYKKIQQNL